MRLPVPGVKIWNHSKFKSPGLLADVAQKGKPVSGVSTLRNQSVEADHVTSPEPDGFQAEIRPAQVIASSRSLLRSPGTMVIGIGSDPELRDICVTSGPGPLRSVPAPRTRTPTSGSS